jgi:hypothetical protein
MDDFLRAHAHHLPQCQLYAARCPFCNIIVREQTDAYPGIIEEIFRPIVFRAWKRWDSGGYRIADNTHPETLLSYLAFSAFSRWVQPKYKETVDLSPEEVSRHPIFLQKNG